MVVIPELGHTRSTSTSTRRTGGVPCILPVLVAVAMLFAGFVVVAPPRVEAATPDVAGLVVSFGGGAYSYAIVPLDGERLDGVTLLERSGLSVLAIDFGGYGQGVCKIEVEGCDVSTCRTRLCQTADSASPFWKYLLTGDSGWMLSPLGASGTSAQAGHVYGWAWAGGTGVPADLPLLSLDEVMSRSGFASESEPQRVSLRSTGLPNVDPRNKQSVVAYLGAGVILLGVAVGGLIILRRVASRARPRSG